MKKLFVLLLMMGTCLLVGCSSSTKITTIGDYDIHGVKYNNFFSKSHSIMVVHNTKTGHVMPASVGVGNGLVSDVLSASGNVGSAYVWGHSIKPDKYESNESDNSSVNLNNAQGQGQLQGQAQGQLQKTKSNSNSSSSSSAKNKNKNSNENSSSGGSFTPPGHINNPGHNNDD